MIAAAMAVGLIFLVLMASEYLWRKDILRGEAARKTIHILTGVFVATWPFFMSFKTIQLLSLALLVVVALSRYFKLFGSIHSVDRKSAGDILFAIGILLTAHATNNKWIFAAAMLHLGLADGLTGLIGSRTKSRTLFKVAGERRTLAASLTFFMCSLLIFGWVTIVAPAGLKDIAIYIPWVAFLVTVVEGLGVWGTDNILVPLVVVLILNSLR
jgi:dolichol kinase